MVKKKKGNTSKLLLLSIASVVSIVATVNPAHDQAASLSPSQLVQKAEGLAKSLKVEISYQHRIQKKKTAFDYPNMALVVQTENALKTAQKAVNKLKGKEKKALEERLAKNVKSHYDHARAYISAVKASKDVTIKTKTLKARLDKGLVDSTTSKEYKDLATALKKNQAAIKKVYEKSMRKGLTEKYVISATKVADTANLAISIKNYETLLDKALKAKDADKSIEYTNKLDQLFDDGKKSGKLNTKSKLYAGLSKTYTNQKAIFHLFVYISNSKFSDTPTLVGSQNDQVKTYNGPIVLVAGKNQYIKLANAVVNGDIIIKGDKTGAGTVYLENVKVNRVKGVAGTIVVEDVADHSLHQDHVIAEQLKVTDVNGANIIASDGTRINSVIVTENAGASGLINLESQEKGTYGSVELAAKGTSKSKGTNLKGNFSESSVSVTGEGSKVSIDKDAEVKEINVNTAATLSAATGANVQSVNLAASKQGQKITINGDFSNSLLSISNANAAITVGEGTKVKEVKKDESVTGTVTIVNNGTIESSQGVEILHNPPVIQPTKPPVDRKPPVVKGVTEGQISNVDLVPTFNEGTAMLSKDGGTPILFPSGGTISAEGNYLLIVTDASGNKTSVSFTIDKTAPEVNGITNGDVSNTSFAATFSEGTATLSKDGGPRFSYSSGDLISDEGEYVLEVFDKAGNKNSIHFTIDKTAPEVSGVTDLEETNQPVTITFTEGTASLTKDNGTSQDITTGYSIGEEGNYVLVISDALGNEKTIHFTIDKTAPVVTGVTDHQKTIGPVTPTFIEGTATLSKDGEEGQPYVSGTPISTEGVYVLVVKDRAGNQTNVNFTIIKVDEGSYISKEITNFDFSPVYATQARQESYHIVSANFQDHPVHFTISDGVYTIPIDLTWDIPLNGFSIGVAVGSAVDSFIQQYCNDHGIDLGKRTMNANGNWGGDTFYLSTFMTGASASITLGGNDWSKFFQTDHYTGTDADNSQNREFTVSDGTHTSSILLDWQYADMDDLVDDINYQLSNASISANAVRITENQFIISPSDSSIHLTIGGKDADKLF